MKHLVLLLIASFTLTILQVSAFILSPPLIFKQPPADELFFRVVNPTLDENDEPFFLECEATGQPPPRYHWRKNGKPFQWQAHNDRIVQQPGRGTLTILQPRDEDSGYYQCEAVNDFGTAISNLVFVHKAELNSFPDENPITLSANEGDPFKLTCQPPDGWPRPNVYWLIQNSDSSIKSINNSRMTVDPEGNLWFSNVTQNDASNDYYYACAAASVFRHEYKLGNRVLLNVISTGASASKNKHEPVRQYVSGKNEVALRGKKIELYCIFGGTPLPQIVWNKNGQFLHPSDRITQGNYGKSLVIKHVSFEDEGQYTCEASNGVGDAKSYSINLRVLAVPIFTVEPEITNAAENETVELRCEASGVPEPQITWIYNGKPIGEATPNIRRKVHTNSLVIEQLTINDTGNYGCNANNSLGYVYKDVYINVLALPPSIEELPSNDETVVGKTIRITCRISGVPKPEIKWLKDDRVLTGGRYVTLESGDLEIERVNFLDTGSYTCQASNVYGITEVTGSLVVKDRTTITDRPEDLQVAIGSTATFRCNAIADSSLILIINWLKNGEPIDFELEPRFAQATDYSLTIQNTEELDSGTYTCVARSELDETQAQATLIVQDVPNPPQIAGVTCTNNVASVSWIPMGDNRAPISKFIIQFNTSFTPNTWENAVDNIQPWDHRYDVPITPWAKYTFRVLARNKIGLSMPSLHSEACTTEPAAPYKNPENVQGEGTGPQNIVISWQPMPQIEHNAPGFRYQVFYKRDMPGEVWTIVDINDWQQYRLQVNDQPTYQRYIIKVLALNEIGESRVPPNEVIGYSGEGVPSEAPTNFTVVEVMGSTTALLSWNPVSEKSMNGNFKGYKIETWTDEDGTQEIHVEKDQTEIIISKFIPFSKNYVKICAYNGRYDGPASETLNFETPEGVPGSVQSLDGFPMGSNALYLVWEKPEKPNGILTGYKIHYRTVKQIDVGPLLERVPSISDPNATRVKLTGLQPSTKYRIHIQAVTKAGDGEEYFIERVTRNDVPASPEIPNFIWEQIPTASETATIKVTWIPSRTGNSGSHFFVKYKIKGETIGQQTSPELYEDNTEVSDLARGQVYEISIVTVDGEYLTESLPQEVNTSSYIQQIEDLLLQLNNSEVQSTALPE